jgi:REP element-mobilizing transposase RayT
MYRSFAMGRQAQGSRTRAQVEAARGVARAAAGAWGNSHPVLHTCDGGAWQSRASIEIERLRRQYLLRALDDNDISSFKMPRPEKQTSLAFPSSWGGKRKGAGRKRKQKRPAVSHASRPALAGKSHPVHTVLRTCVGCWNLRSRRALAALAPALSGGSDRFGFRLVHYSIQCNHLHLIVEADDRRSLSRGMQGLTIRLAKALNRMMARHGRVFADHYFARILMTPREVANAVKYVLENRQHHAAELGIVLPADYRDPFASAEPVVAPRTWLLSVGWRRGMPAPKTGDTLPV